MGKRKKQEQDFLQLLTPSKFKLKWSLGIILFFGFPILGLCKGQFLHCSNSQTAIESESTEQEAPLFLAEPVAEWSGTNVDTIIVENGGDVAQKINNRLKAVNKEKCVLIFPKGIYQTNSAIQLRENTKVIGNGSTILSNPNKKNPVFYIYNTSNVHLQDFKIDGRQNSKVRHVVYDNQGILIDAQLNNIDQISISNIEISNMAGSGILIRCWSNKTLQNVLIDKIKMSHVNYGILGSTLGAKTNNITDADIGIHRIQISNCDISTYNGSGIQFTKAKSISILYNNVHDCIYGHGIVVDLSNDVKILNNVATNQTGDNNQSYGGWGIAVSRECYNFLVQGNQCKFNQAGGITIDLTPSNRAVKNIDAKSSIVAQNICEQNKGMGISTNYAKNVVISENECLYNEKGMGIYNSEKIQIKNNLIENNQIGITINYGEKENDSKVSILGNSIQDNKRMGIFWDKLTVAPKMINNSFKNNKVDIWKSTSR